MTFTLSISRKASGMKGTIEGGSLNGQVACHCHSWCHSLAQIMIQSFLIVLQTLTKLLMLFCTAKKCSVHRLSQNTVRRSHPGWLERSIAFPYKSGLRPPFESWWSKNTQQHPWCLVQPHDAKEVSVALTSILEIGERAGDWHIAVRSGGHMMGHSSNNMDDGVTIGLGMLNQTTYDSSTNLASLQPGSK